MKSIDLSQTKSFGLSTSFHILIVTIEFSVLIHYNSSKKKKKKLEKSMEVKRNIYVTCKTFLCLVMNRSKKFTARYGINASG